MKHVFPSEPWIDRYARELDASAEYRDAASTWSHGAIALVVKPEPERGALAHGFGVWLDVERGRCRGARRVSLDEAATAPFCIAASYDRWKDVLASRLDPIAGLVTRRLELRGSLVTMLRYVRSAKAMVRCAAAIPVEFLA